MEGGGGMGGGAVVVAGWWGGSREGGGGGVTAVCFNGEEGGRCLHGRVFGVSVVSVQCFVFSFIEREKN